MDEGCREMGGVGGYCRGNNIMHAFAAIAPIVVVDAAVLSKINRESEWK
jgi:hypothetical protein